MVLIGFRGYSWALMGFVVLYFGSNLVGLVCFYEALNCSDLIKRVEFVGASTN